MAQIVITLLFYNYNKYIIAETSVIKYNEDQSFQLFRFEPPTNRLINLEKLCNLLYKQSTNRTTGCTNTCV